MGKITLAVRPRLDPGLSKHALPNTPFDRLKATPAAAGDERLGCSARYPGFPFPRMIVGDSPIDQPCIALIVAFWVKRWPATSSVMV